VRCEEEAGVIELVTGKPGHGKSYYAVTEILRALESGKYVATNVELREGWPFVFARANQLRRLIPGRVRRTAEAYATRVYVTHDLAVLGRLRLPPCGRCEACRAGGRCRRESRGVMVLDEAHNWLNARTWDQDEAGRELTRAQAVQARLAVVRLFSQHRKLGWDVKLLTQDEGNLDNQVRRNFEYHTHLKNLRRYRVFGLVPVVPVNVFVAITTWHDNARSRVGTRTFLLNRKLARCYDTMATSHGLDYEDADAIHLPLAPAPAGAAKTTQTDVS
jgi:hypothetical protein